MKNWLHWLTLAYHSNHWRPIAAAWLTAFGFAVALLMTRPFGF